MIDRILHLAIERRWLVLLAAFAIAALGVWNYQRLPIDAVPDITNVQVQINTEAPGYTPLEAEQRITFVVETAMGGLPKLDYTRSLSRYGLSQVTVVFEDGTDIYFARQLVAERLQAVQSGTARRTRAADGADRDGPRRDLHVHGRRGTGRDECRRHAGNADRSANRPGLGDTAAAAARSRRHRSEHHRRLRQAIPRDAESREAARVRSQVSTTCRKRSRRATATSAPDTSNTTARSFWCARRARSRASKKSGRSSLRVATTFRSGSPTSPQVNVGKELRTGAATQNGAEVVLGTAFMLTGENSRTVSERVASKLAQVNESLPPASVQTPCTTARCW